MPRRLNRASNADDLQMLSQFMAPISRDLLTGSGTNFIRQIGFDIIRGILFDVLTGKNLRDSTEPLTRRRITALNLAMMSLFLKGSSHSPDFLHHLPYLASNILTHKGIPKAERWLAQWMLGLTDKAVQNVLRDNKALLEVYRDGYIQACQEIVDNHKSIYGELAGELKLSSESEIHIDWLFMTYLLNAIGAETLTIRGSDKSSLGKLFEKLVLGSLLSILGFRQVAPHQLGEGVFWLSSSSEKRESDATLLYELGKGVRFDIGFIGRGNPEISLDKVTRFQREEILAGERFYMATIIIVDRIGGNSRIVDMARAVHGHIVQMSASYWPQEVAQLLNNTLGFEHELVNMDQVKIGDYLKDKLNQIPLENFVTALSLDNGTDVEDSSVPNDNEIGDGEDD